MSTQVPSPPKTEGSASSAAGADVAPAQATAIEIPRTATSARTPGLYGRTVKALSTEERGLAASPSQPVCYGFCDPPSHNSARTGRIRREFR
jgi:hypothetical protein